MNLQQGSRGQDVINLQNQLKAAGFDPGAADGVFGPKTQAAVKAYQQASGLAVDGIAGKNTLGSLSAPKSATTPTAPAPTVKAPANTPAPASAQPQSPNIPTYQPFTPTVQRPDMPNLPQAPSFGAFNPNINQGELQKQALDLLKPQLERGQEQLQDLYGMNVQGINDDSLKRGWARGSFTGNRIDRETTDHGKRLGDLDRNYNEQANMMAAQNYDKEYDRQYRSYQDTIANSWRQYQAETDRIMRDYESLMSLYNLDLGIQQSNYNNQMTNDWKVYDASYGQQRDAVGDKRYEQEFGMKQDQFNWQKQMDQENLKLSQYKAYNDPKNDPYAGKLYSMAYEDVFSSSNPYETFSKKQNEYRSRLSPQEFEALKAQAEAWKLKTQASIGNAKNQSKTNAKKTGGLYDIY